MKVLLILPDSLHNPMGGMGVQARGLMAEMPDYSFEVLAADRDYTGGVNYRLHPYYSTSPIVGLNTVQRQIEEQTNIMESVIRNVLLQGEMPDVVHSFDWSTALAGMRLATALNRPFVYTMQLSFSSLISQFYKNQVDSIYQQAMAIEMQAMQVADVAIHVSNEYLQKYGILNPSASYYMPNGISMAEWNGTAYRQIDLPGRPDAVKVGYIGRYAEMKNIEGILDAIMPWNVDMYFMGSDRGGDPMFFRMMQDYVASHDNAYYLGPVYGEEKVNTLRALDALIVPSHHEPFGIVCLEALATQCLLLSSFKGGMGEFLSEDVAINCGTSADTISEALDKVASLSLDEVQERRQKGLALCHAYSWERSAQVLRQLYEVAIDNHNNKKLVVEGQDNFTE